MCSEWHYTTGGLAYGDMTTRPDGLVVLSPSANLPRCVMPFWTHTHAFSLYYSMIYWTNEHNNTYSRITLARLWLCVVGNRPLAEPMLSYHPILWQSYESSSQDVLMNLTMWSQIILLEITATSYRGQCVKYPCIPVCMDKFDFGEFYWDLKKTVWWCMISFPGCC